MLPASNLSKDILEFFKIFKNHVIQKLIRYFLNTKDKYDLMEKKKYLHQEIQYIRSLNISKFLLNRFYKKGIL